VLAEEARNGSLAFSSQVQKPCGIPHVSGSACGGAEGHIHTEMGRR